MHLKLSAALSFLLSSAPAMAFTGKCFTTREELQAAVDTYVANPTQDSVVSQMYGFPIGDWCVSEIEDFSYLFDSNRNPAMANFNEDLTNWCTCSATDMSYMFAGARRFNGDVSSFVTAEVVNMQGMFEGAAACKC